MIYFNMGDQRWDTLMKLQLSVSETVAVPWLSFPQKNSFSLFLNCHRSQMSHLNYMWFSEHINEYNSFNLYKYVWIHPILHCFLLSGWMLLVSAAFPLHDTTWGVWFAASGPLSFHEVKHSRTVCPWWRIWGVICVRTGLELPLDIPSF